MRERRFLLTEEECELVDVSRRAMADAPPEALGAMILLCPHCGHDERSDPGPHEMFDLLWEEVARRPLPVSQRHFRCRLCGETSPIWSFRRNGQVTTHLVDLSTGQACMPLGFHSSRR